MIISVDAEKPLKKIQHTFIIKALEYVDRRNTSLQDKSDIKKNSWPIQK